MMTNEPIKTPGRPKGGQGSSRRSLGRKDFRSHDRVTDDRNSACSDLGPTRLPSGSSRRPVRTKLER